MTEPRILQTAGGHTIEVYGAHLISPKLFDITAMLYTAGDYFGEFEVQRIVFTDELLEPTQEKPEGKFGAFAVAEKSVIISLQKHFLAACRNVQTEDNVHAKYMSLRASLWWDLITSLLHEGFHAVQWDTAPEHCAAAHSDPSRLKEIEDDCTHNANILLIDLFRDFDIEPPAIGEEPYFGARFMEFFVQQIQNKDSEWAIRQEIMVETNLMYYDGEDKDGLATMRDWLRLTNEGDPDEFDERWDAKPKPIPAAHANPAVMVAGADTTPKEVALRPDTQVVAVGNAGVAQTVAAVGAVDEFSMLMSEEDLVAELQDNEYPSHFETMVEEVMDDAVAPELTEMFQRMDAATKQQSLFPDVLVQPQTIEEAGDRVLEIVSQEVEAKLAAGPKHCTNCGYLIEAAKFCPECGTKIVRPEAAPQLPLFMPGQNVNKTPEQIVHDQFITGAQTVAQPTNPPKFNQEMRTGLPNIGMDVGTMKGILGEVYNRMHSHIFEKCGFQLCGAGTGNAVGFNNSMVGNVLQPISIADIPRASELIIAYDKYDTATGKTIMKVPVNNGLLAGKVSKTSGVPMYAIYINNNGTECKRLILSQNPFKTNANGYTAPATKAQQGNRISWVMDGGDGKQYRSWFYKNENGITKWL